MPLLDIDGDPVPVPDLNFEQELSDSNTVKAVLPPTPCLSLFGRIVAAPLRIPRLGGEPDKAKLEETMIRLSGVQGRYYLGTT